ncbi:hypothetical protein NDU88_002828 [Pleurodeles waltl]|uniref:Uncharacterized protein n=1 Tax=Pleurodeles waltl TaxID=8319 RepID=A0AAV7VFJ0_PLEWA|nr:hypothetical protein NDU88_002828 [Pleurodeles waltl]
MRGANQEEESGSIEQEDSESCSMEQEDDKSNNVEQEDDVHGTVNQEDSESVDKELEGRRRTVVMEDIRGIVLVARSQG